MSVLIYVFAEDVTIKTEKENYNSTPPRPGRRVVIPDGTPHHMLTSYIKRAKAKHEKISTLNLISHGAPGQLFLSGANHPPIDQAGNWWFGALRGHFDPTFPMVVIHGCNIASNYGHNPVTGIGWYGFNQSGVGYDYCRSMAQATQAFVQAGIHAQYNDSAHEMEGPTITVSPKGEAFGTEFAL